MDINIYEVIRGPLVTHKNYQLNNVLKQIVLEVHVAANKPMIAQALKKLFDIEAKSIRVINMKGKRRVVKRHISQDKLQKKAIITLKRDTDINLIDPENVGNASARTAVSSTAV